MTMTTNEKACKADQALRQLRTETPGDGIVANRVRNAITEYLTGATVISKARLYDLVTATPAPKPHPFKTDENIGSCPA